MQKILRCFDVTVACQRLALRGIDETCTRLALRSFYHGTLERNRKALSLRKKIMHSACTRVYVARERPPEFHLPRRPLSPFLLPQTAEYTKLYLFQHSLIQATCFESLFFYQIVKKKLNKDTSIFKHIIQINQSFKTQPTRRMEDYFLHVTVKYYTSSLFLSLPQYSICYLFMYKVLTYIIDVHSVGRCRRNVTKDRPFVFSAPFRAFCLPLSADFSRLRRHRGDLRAVDRRLGARRINSRSLRAPQWLVAISATACRRTPQAPATVREGEERQ